MTSQPFMKTKNKWQTAPFALKFIFVLSLTLHISSWLILLIPQKEIQIKIHHSTGCSLYHYSSIAFLIFLLIFNATEARRNFGRWFIVISIGLLTGMEFKLLYNLKMSNLEEKYWNVIVGKYEIIFTILIPVVFIALLFSKEMNEYCRKK